MFSEKPIEAEILAAGSRDFARSICRLGRLERAHVSGRPRRSAADKVMSARDRSRLCGGRHMAKEFPREPEWRGVSGLRIVIPHGTPDVMLIEIKTLYGPVRLSMPKSI